MNFPVPIPHSVVDTVSAQEYLRRERLVEDKNEYWKGRILARPGGTYRHNLIAVNVAAAIYGALRDSRCEVFGCDQRIRVAATEAYFYPDVTVVCEPIDIFDEDCLQNPSILVEVSPLGDAFDFAVRFRAYRQIPSLQHFVLVAVDESRVEHWERIASGLWTLVGEHDALTDCVAFSEPAFSVPVAEIYRRVRFEQTEGTMV